MAASTRAVRAAQKEFKAAMPGRFHDRSWALNRIASAKYPAKEATRLVAWFRDKKGIYKGATAATAPTATNDNAKQGKDTGDILIYEVPLSRIPSGGIAARPPLRRVEKPQADPYADQVDPSDVHELRVRLYRKRGCNGWPTSDPQYRLLNELDRDVANGDVTSRTEFNKRSAVIEGVNDGWNVKRYHDQQAAILAEGKRDLGTSGGTLSPALRINHA